MGQQQTDRASRRSHRQQSVRRRSRAPVDRQPQVRRRQGSVGIWLNLFRRHSPLLLVITWVLLLGAAIAAVTAIVDPKFSVQSSSLNAKPNSEMPSPSSALAESDALQTQRLNQQTQRPRRNQTTDSRSALSTGGALLISCAGGCLLLSRCLQPQSAPRRKRRTPKLATQAQPLIFDTTNQTSQTASLPESPAVGLSNTVGAHHIVRQPESFAASSLPETPVSVLAPDQSHPLDWNEPSLADSLDIRHKRPLSYWLRG